MEKVLIEVAVSGVQLPSLSPHIPITPDEIADEIIKCWEQGAAIAQYQARNPGSGEPIADVQLFREVADKVKKRCDIVLCVNTEGGINQTVEQRLEVIPSLDPEMATLKIGPHLSDAFQRLKGQTEFKHPWEREYMERSYYALDPFMYALPAPERWGKYARAFAKYDVKPEIEIADPRDLDVVGWMLEDGLVKKPLYLHFVLGDGLRLNIEYVAFVCKTAQEAFEDVQFAISGVGESQMAFVGVGLALGGHARVGIGDSCVDSRGRLVRSSAEQVTATVGMIQGLGYVAGTPSDAREMLGLKGLAKVKF